MGLFDKWLQILQTRSYIAERLRVSQDKMYLIRAVGAPRRVNLHRRLHWEESE
jgi:hypothetical protein